ncbi:hypothetical protein GCM10025868_18890 [Angustibacter aerolatus]|uniref:DUF305 domain-containing protein n=1 Tax=Angustibacter aerolatus TaxID=1162965 RepID=A0ABQ6JFR0_9ACTN|nr:hypothetical protein GCM10025868_18890 [Angustibacter aerolatus]
MLPLVAAVLVLLAALGGFAVGRLVTPSTTPADDSAAAGFARDMQAHHAQAVDMSFTVLARTDDPEVRTLAYDIATTQQQQIGQMYGWLVAWGLPQTGRRPAMAWMSEGGHAHAATPAATASASGGAGGTGTAAMPGMASAADLQRLAGLSGRPAEVLYLQAMIAHHHGGVEMAQEVLALPAPTAVHDLARSIVASQTSEITAMQQMLRARGATA